MQINEPAVQYIFAGMPHQTGHSGYDQLTKYIASRVLEPNFFFRLLDLCPERVLAQLRRTAGPWYNSNALKQELQNIPDFIFKSRRIYHFLFGEDGYYYSGYLNHRKSNKLVATFHMPPQKFLEINKGYEHLKKLDSAVIVAPNQEELFKNMVPPDKVHLISCGVDTRFFHPQQTKKNGKNCLFVGVHLRDFLMLRQAMQEIYRQDTSVTFTVVTFKNCFNHFEGLKNVELYAGVSEKQLISLYHAADLLLIPLHDSTANLAVLEAMACGLPVVSTRVGGISMYCNGENAVLVQPGDVSGMAAAVLDITNDDILRHSMARAARKKAEQFDWHIIAGEIMTLYLSMFYDS